MVSVVISLHLNGTLNHSWSLAGGGGILQTRSWRRAHLGELLLGMFVGFMQESTSTRKPHCPVPVTHREGKHSGTYSSVYKPKTPRSHHANLNRFILLWPILTPGQSWDYYKSVEQRCSSSFTHFFLCYCVAFGPNTVVVSHSGINSRLTFSCCIKK